MAAQLSPHSSTQPSPATDLTTPEESPSHEDDIWASSSDDDRPSDTTTAQSRRQETLSDLPSIRRQHMTSGYREGLSVGKARVMQSGFDAGYPLGIQIASRAGPVLGILEGYLACKSIILAPGLKELVQKTYALATDELSIASLLRGVDDEVVRDAGPDLPDSVAGVLNKWEGIAYGVWKTREETKRMHWQQNHELREMARGEESIPPAEERVDVPEDLLAEKSPAT